MPSRKPPAYDDTLIEETAITYIRENRTVQFGSCTDPSFVELCKKLNYANITDKLRLALQRRWKKYMNNSSPRSSIRSPQSGNENGIPNNTKRLHDVTGCSPQAEYNNSYPTSLLTPPLEASSNNIYLKTESENNQPIGFPSPIHQSMSRTSSEFTSLSDDSFNKSYDSDIVNSDDNELSDSSFLKVPVPPFQIRNLPEKIPKITKLFLPPSNTSTKLDLFAFESVDSTICHQKFVGSDVIELDNPAFELLLRTCCQFNEVNCDLIFKTPVLDDTSDYIEVIAYCKYPSHQCQFHFILSNFKTSEDSVLYCFSSSDIYLDDKYHNIDTSKRPKIEFIKQRIDVENFIIDNKINKELCRDAIRKILEDQMVTCVLSFKDVVFNQCSQSVKIRGSCKHGNHNCDYKFTIYLKPEPVLIGLTNGNPKVHHKGSIAFPQIRGAIRTEYQTVMSHGLAPQMVHEKLSKTANVSLAKKGNPGYWFPPQLLQKANSERKCWEDLVKGCVLHAAIECVDEKCNTNENRFVQSVSNPMAMTMYSPKQGKLLRSLTRGKKRLTANFDATGTTIQKPRCHKKHTSQKPLYYALTISLLEE
jgi:hypothetical protein